MPKEAVSSAEKMLKSWAPKLFIGGLVLAILVGIWAASTSSGKPIDWAVYLLVLLGIVVGWFNITKSEVIGYLLSVIALLLGTTYLNMLFSLIPGIGSVLSNILSYVVVFLASGSAVVALRHLVELARD
jgi:hypothetical protein